MKKDTFGNIETHKALAYLTEQIGELDPKKKAKISTFIIRFNTIIGAIRVVEDASTRRYMLGLLRKDYKQKVENLRGRYDDLLLNYLNNFIHGKGKVVLKEEHKKPSEVNNEPDYKGFGEHLCEWWDLGVPYGLSDLVTLAKKYNTPIPTYVGGMLTFKDIKNKS